VEDDVSSLFDSDIVDTCNFEVVLPVVGILGVLPVDFTTNVRDNGDGIDLCSRKFEFGIFLVVDTVTGNAIT
jgi:hypothetical protein